MLALDTISPSAKPPRSDERRAPTASEPDVLARAVAGLGVDNNWRWAWDNYKHTIQNLSGVLKARRLIEIGGGRDPLFNPNEIADLDVEMTVNDIAPAELEFLPPGYRTAVFDVTGDLSSVGHLRNTFDLAFSRMVFEHVVDGRRAWANLHELLAPGGIALAFIPTLYAFPFLVNWLLPHKIGAAIVKTLRPERVGEDDPVFPAIYSWCFADSTRMQSMFSTIGYREVVVLPFYGHGYYGNIPIVRDIHERFTGIARRNDWRTLATFAYILARK